MPNIYTTRQVADLFGAKTWRVRRLFEDGTLPDPPRFGRHRMIDRSLLPEILDALRERGWLPEPETEGVAFHPPRYSSKFGDKFRFW